MMANQPTLIPLTSPVIPSKDGDEWYTPPKFIEAARRVMGGIDLDPASCDHAQRVIRAGHHYTQTEDGLIQPWFGRVWLNPPYSSPARWIERAVGAYQAGRVTEAVILVNNGTETSWGQLVLAYPVCFPSRRIAFWRDDPKIPQSGNRYAQMIAYLGQRPGRFVAEFGRFGPILAPMTTGGDQ